MQPQQFPPNLGTRGPDFKIPAHANPPNTRHILLASGQAQALCRCGKNRPMPPLGLC